MSIPTTNPCTLGCDDDFDIVTIADLLQIQADREGFFGEPAVLVERHGATGQASICSGCGLVAYANADGTYPDPEVEPEG